VHETIRIVAVELIKLKRSLVLLLCTAAPMCVAILAVLMFLRWNKPESWTQYMMSGAGLWAFFMLPMSITALTVLVAQLEHGTKGWSHILALPVPRWKVYFAKALIVLGLVAAMTVGMMLLLPLSGYVAEQLRPGDQILGEIPWSRHVRLLGTMYLGSILAIGIQLWVALRFKSFVPPLVLGIGGTFVAVAATGAEEGVFFPWTIPINALASDPERAVMATNVGLFGGMAVLLVMVIQLARAEVR
jgi:ABC-2 type transport system permease protein